MQAGSELIIVQIVDVWNRWCISSFERLFANNTDLDIMLSSRGTANNGKVRVKTISGLPTILQPYPVNYTLNMK